MNFIPIDQYMKKFLTVILLLTFLIAGSASAYVINFKIPSTVESGTSLFIDGTSSIPAGFTTEVVIYKKAQVGNNEVATIPFTIQNEGKWSVSVDTTGWAAGEYTLNIPKNSEYSYGSASNLLRAFTVTADTTPTTPAITPAVTQTAQATQTYMTPDVTVSPEKTPYPTTTPVALWICPAGLFLALLLIRTGFVSKRN